MFLDLLPRPRNELSWEGRRKATSLRSHGSTRAQRITAKRKYAMENSESQWKFGMEVKAGNSLFLQLTDANAACAARHEATRRADAARLQGYKWQVS